MFLLKLSHGLPHKKKSHRLVKCLTIKANPIIHCRKMNKARPQKTKRPQSAQPKKVSPQMVMTAVNLGFHAGKNT